MDINDIRLAVSTHDRFAGGHANQECADDGLRVDEIWDALLLSTAVIIEDYPTDPRGSSCLILCFVQARPVHVVIAYPAKRYAAQRQVNALAFMITAYRPDLRPTEWASDYHTRIP